MLFSGARPMQALRMFSSIALCFESAFTTGVPGGTCRFQTQQTISNISTESFKKSQSFFSVRIDGKKFTYQWSFGQVTQDRSHWVEGVELAL